MSFVSVADNDDHLVVIGRVGAPHGVRGWVRIQSFTENKDDIKNFLNWELSSKTSESSLIVKVLEIKPHGNNFVALLEGIKDRNIAATLTNCNVMVRRSSLPEIDLDLGYYWSDLLGMQVFNEAGIDFGQVVDFLETGANDVLVTRDQNGTEHLIPYVEDHYILDVSLDKQEIQVDWELEV